MAITASQLQKILDNITKEIEGAYKGLSMFFVVHHLGKMRESIALAEHEIVSHPAGQAARTIIRKHTNTEKSSFLGLAISSDSKMIGFQKTDHLLGLFNINIDEFDTREEAILQIYHLAWHAIDLFEIRQLPKYRSKFKAGPMVPKRSPMNSAKAYLQADAFAVCLAALKNQGDFVDQMAVKRATNALQPVNNFTPEDFPSVIAKDACKMAVAELMKRRIPPSQFIENARKLSVDVGHAFDEQNIKQWWNFTIPSQDMAWRGFSKEHILGAAIHTSNDPYVRSIGYLVQDVTGIIPAEATETDGGYNAFIDPEVLKKLHKEMVDTIFEDAVTKGLQESSSRAFLNAANKLNERLTDGHILGWCANSLQDAANAFERALLNGASPDQAARMQFEGNKNHPKWETLKDLGNNIVDQKRQGFAVTMGHIAEICHNQPAFAPVLDALKITMNDPSYIQKLEASNDLSIAPRTPAPKGLEPNAPIPKGMKPKEPIPNTPAPSMPAPPPAGMAGPGGESAARIKQMMYQRQMAAQKAKEESQGSKDRP